MVATRRREGPTIPAAPKGVHELQSVVRVGGGRGDSNELALGGVIVASVVAVYSYNPPITITLTQRVALFETAVGNPTGVVSLARINLAANRRKRKLKRINLVVQDASDRKVEGGQGGVGEGGPGDVIESGDAGVGGDLAVDVGLLNEGENGAYIPLFLGNVTCRNLGERGRGGRYNVPVRNIRKSALKDWV